MGCMWTGEFDMNTLHANGKKKLRIQKYFDTCEWGLRIIIFLNVAWMMLVFTPHKMCTRVSY